MQKSNITLLIAVAAAFVFTACKTYTIPVDSFKEQLQNANKTEVRITNPLSYNNIPYTANNLDSIQVTGKDNNTLYLKNSPALEMRVTLRNGKKQYCYFDTAVLENDTLKATKSRFMPSFTLQVPIDSIVNIEVQDGGKNFKYKN